MFRGACFALFTLLLAAPGCNQPKQDAHPTPAEQNPVKVEPPAGDRPSLPVNPQGAPAPGTTSNPVTVNIQAASGSDVAGTAKLYEDPKGVKVVVDINKAPPGEHAIHIHEKGDCSDPAAKSAGDHFAPEHNHHGLPNDHEHHLGDMGDLTVGADKTGRLEFVVEGANLKPGDPHSLIGRAIILHAKKDDGSQPAGNAGERIGCGVIGGPTKS